MKNFTIILIIAIFGYNCNKHYIRQSKYPEIPKEIQQKIQNKKIALIGFYPFHAYQTGSYTSGRTTYTTMTAVLDYKNSTKPFIKQFQPIDQIKESGLNTGVPENQVKEFVKFYLEKVKKSGLDELSKVVDAKKIDDKTTKLSLKKRDIDYYVVGIHGPPFIKSSTAGIGKFFLSVFFFMGTAGTVPLWGDKTVTSEFHVFDKNLQFVKKYEYSNVYNVLTAWWGNSDEGSLGTNDNDAARKFKPNLYKPDTLDFAYEFSEFLASQPN